MLQLLNNQIVIIVNMKFTTLRELINAIPDNKTAHQYLAGERWHNGVIECAYCDSDEAYVYKDGITYKCKKCRKQFRATTGTMMENTKLPLIDWLIAIHLLTHKKGISSIQLAKDIGVTQKTAWIMAHKIRTHMAGNPDEMLEGTVEMDEAFVGGKSAFKHKNKRMKYNPGRSWSDKVPVFGLIQRNHVNSRGDIIPSRVKAFVMGNVEMLTITKAVRQNVKIGSNLMGDGFMAYRVLEKQYNLKSVDHSKGWYVDGNCHTNTIEGFWSQMKKQLKSTHHFVSPKHLQKYVDECAFKYNFRNLDVQEQVECLIRNMYPVRKSA